jgi:FkbM family methyltransferase
MGLRETLRTSRLGFALADAYQTVRFATGFAERMGSVQTKAARVTPGTAYGGCTITSEGMGPKSVAYSVGTGEDISFDLALIEKYGCEVHGFDPTPKSVAWVKKQTTPPNFRFHEWGLAGHDGTVDFFLPANPNHVSASVVHRPGTSDQKVTVQVRRVSTVMKELGHAKVDLLKIDIEGAEYGVIDDIEKLFQERGSVPIHQILVEFHHRFFSDGRERTRRAINQLNACGYRVFDISADDIQYGFVAR